MIQMLLASGVMSLMISLVVYQIYQARWLTHHGRQVIAMVTSIRQEIGKTAWGFSRENYYITAALDKSSHRATIYILDVDHEFPTGVYIWELDPGFDRSQAPGALYPELLREVLSNAY